MLHGENVSSREAMIRCLKLSGDLRAIKVLSRLEFNIIDCQLQRILEEWDQIFAEAKAIDYNIAKIGEAPVSTNQNYAIQKGYEAMVDVQTRAANCLSDLLSY